MSEERVIRISRDTVKREKRSGFFSVNVNKFALQNIENSGAFLGYLSRYRHVNMNFSLVGTKNRTDIHSVQAMRPALAVILRLVKSVAANSGSFWVIAPSNNSLVTLYPTVKEIEGFFTMEYLRKHLVFWKWRWMPGSLTNRTALKPLLKHNRFPSMIFQPNYSSAQQVYCDALGSNTLQTGIVDSSAKRPLHSYWVSANEKTPVTNRFFVKLCVTTMLATIYLKKAGWMLPKFCDKTELETMRRVHKFNAKPGVVRTSVFFRRPKNYYKFYSSRYDFSWFRGLRAQLRADRKTLAKKTKKVLRNARRRKVRARQLKASNKPRDHLQAKKKYFSGRNNFRGATTKHYKGQWKHPPAKYAANATGGYRSYRNNRDNRVMFATFPPTPDLPNNNKIKQQSSLKSADTKAKKIPNENTTLDGKRKVT